MQNITLIIVTLIPLILYTRTYYLFIICIINNLNDYILPN